MFEKKNGKRFLASVMALVMLLSLAPVGALAADEKTPEETPAVTLPAEEGSTQVVVDPPSEDTPTTQPAQDPKPVVVDPVESSSEAVILPEGDLLDQAFGVNPDAANSNDIAEYKGGNKGDREPVTTDSTTKYVIRFYVSNTGTEDSYEDTADGKYVIKDQPNSTYTGAVGQSKIELSVAPGYAILTQYNDEAKNISTTDFEDVNITGDENVRTWLAKYAKNGVPTGLTQSNNVDTIVEYVNNQYKNNSNGYELPTLNKDNYNAFRFVDAHYVDQGESSIHVHVQLIKQKQYIVEYRPNGGNGAMVDEKLYVEGGQATVKANEFTRTGYTFTGWNTDENGNGTRYAPNDTITIGTANVTLYAQWTPQTYRINYELDGGTNADTNPTGYTYGEGVSSFAPATKDKYDFEGWYSDPEFKNEVESISATDTGDKTLYANWKEQTGQPDPDPEKPDIPDTETVDAMYFVLLPGQGVPTSGVSKGVDKYFPNADNNGGVTGKSNTTGYEGKITKAATELTGANTSNGYFDVNGVGDQYLKYIGDLGYFNAKNYKADGTYTGTLPDGLKNFNMTNKEIVWYVIKKESNGYHVDGYVKGVPIQLNYYDGFDGQEIGTENLQSGDSVTIKSLPDNVTHEGWVFVGWFTKDGKKYEVSSSHTLIDSLNLYARWEKSYEVVTHFMDADGKEKETRTNSNLEGVHGTPLKDMVLSLKEVNTEGISGNYVYVPSETSYSVNEVDKGKVGDATYTEANTVIHQYYYLDETGKTGKDEENKPTDESDEIPDAWQHKVTFKVVNGKWNDHDNSDDIVVYVNAKDKDGNTLESKLTATQIPAAGDKPNSGYRASGSWDKTPSVGLEIKEDTEFTFTYSRRSSSGGNSRPSNPIVDIPDDDVPTGLNGADHYAYIIGYGNNDVRPQQSITRAEVATIFFRLLTDETREANMTKNQNYSDVKDSDWYCRAVATLSSMGIIKGYNDGTFQPNAPITRAEFAAIAARFDPDGDTTPASFSDVGSHWAKDEISIAANHGWINGYEDGTFKPDRNITRAEAVTLINRVLKRLPETKEDLHEDMKTWVDNMDESAWYYLAIQEATNGHYNKNKEGTKYETWTDLRENRDWSELEK